MVISAEKPGFICGDLNKFFTAEFQKTKSVAFFNLQGFTAGTDDFVLKTDFP